MGVSKCIPRPSFTDSYVLATPAGAMMVASFLALATGLSVKRRTAFTGDVDYR